MDFTPTLKVKNLCKSFGTLSVVKDLNFEVKPSQCFALLGPNGAGKTTTLSILEGLLPADSGTVEICGLNYKKNREEIYKSIGVVLQHTHLYKRMTVRETVELFAALYDSAKGCDELLNKFGLEEKANTRLMELSGGQKQRVYLACALVHSPKILFLDEPSTGLDPQARLHLWDLILGFKKSGIAILLTTHAMDEAAILADDVAIMDQGSIIAHGSPAALVQQHGTVRADTPPVPNLEDVFIHLTGRKLRDV